jgi:hypothetical protein
MPFLAAAKSNREKKESLKKAQHGIIEHVAGSV